MKTKSKKLIFFAIIFLATLLLLSNAFADCNPKDHGTGCWNSVCGGCGQSISCGGFKGLPTCNYGAPELWQTKECWVCISGCNSEVHCQDSCCNSWLEDFLEIDSNGFFNHVRSDNENMFYENCSAKEDMKGSEEKIGYGNFDEEEYQRNDGTKDYEGYIGTFETESSIGEKEWFYISSREDAEKCALITERRENGEYCDGESWNTEIIQRFCNSENCIDNVCCEQEECVTCSTGNEYTAGGATHCENGYYYITGKPDQDVWGDRIGGFKCDADRDGVYCGTVSCAGGVTTNRGDSEPVETGECACINDDPDLFFPSGEFTTSIPAITLTDNFVSSDHKVIWYDLTIEGEGLGNGPGDTNVLFKPFVNSEDETEYNDIEDTGKTTTTLYTDGQNEIQSDNLSFKIKLETENSEITPNVTRVTARSFPRLYNISGNVKQGKGVGHCWPIKEAISCNLDDKGINIVECHPGRNTTVVEAVLNDYSYEENNLFDNSLYFEDNEWCYNPTHSPVIEDNTGETCTQNSECTSFCCENPTGVSNAGICVSPIYEETEEGFQAFSFENPGITCGINVGNLCDENLDCSTYCCDNTNKCVFPNEDESNCMRG